jgi:uncharacterized protein RhaS with RHS repeats
MPARYYSPALGRFLQSDPAGFRGGLNLYAYAENDPINFVDPTGLTADASATVITPFMGVLGIPSITISATAHQQGLALFPTSETVSPGSIEVTWRLRTIDGQSTPSQHYLVFEHLSRNGPNGSDPCSVLGTICQSDGTAIGPSPSYGAKSPGYPSNQAPDVNVFRGDNYGGTAYENVTQSFTVQLMRNSQDLTYDPTRQISVPIIYGDGTIWGSQGISHGPGGYATVYVNGYTQIPSVPQISGEF